jgi:hypothetical protein
MAKTLLRLSPVVFVLSAIVHVLTFVPGLVISIGWVWPLHITVIAVFIAMFFAARPVLKGQRNDEGVGHTWPQRALRSFRAAFLKRGPSFGEFWRRITRRVPIPFIALCVMMAGYTFFDFSVVMDQMKGGNPIEENGKYFLQHAGHTIRVIDRDEYDRLRAYEVRGFSGHWMLFALIPTVFSIFVCPQLSEGGVADANVDAVEK